MTEELSAADYVALWAETYEPAFLSIATVLAEHESDEYRWAKSLLAGEP
jgi:hypothetical protein